MPSRATTQIARDIQKPSACWSSASGGGETSVLNAPTSQQDAVDSPSDEPRLDRHGCAIKQLLPDERLLLAPARSACRWYKKSDAHRAHRTESIAGRSPGGASRRRRGPCWNQESSQDRSACNAQAYRAAGKAEGCDEESAAWVEHCYWMISSARTRTD